MKYGPNNNKPAESMEKKKVLLNEFVSVGQRGKGLKVGGV